MVIFKFFLPYSLFIFSSWFFLSTTSVLALPPTDDIPEEVLATEIILDVRSHLDNQFLSAQEYELLKQREENSAFPPMVNSSLSHQIFLLNLLRFVGFFPL